MGIMGATGTTSIDKKYVFNFLTNWCQKNDFTKSKLSMEILNRSNSYLNTAIYDGRIRKLELKVLCEYTGMDYDRAIWTQKAEASDSSDTSENEGG